jgi:hypothetical protein
MNIINKIENSDRMAESESSRFSGIIKTIVKKVARVFRDFFAMCMMSFVFSHAIATVKGLVNTSTAHKKDGQKASRAE